MKPTDKIIAVDPVHPPRRAIARAADAVRGGGVVIVPTSGLYGLAADALNADAVDRLFRIKGRGRDKAILVLIASPEMLPLVAHPPGALTRMMMAHFWPGQVTFVVPAKTGLPIGLTGGGGRIGVRLVAHPVARAVIQALGSPLTGTSANIAGAGGCADIGDIERGIIDDVELVLDAGKLAGGPGSTVVDLTDGSLVVLREGVVQTSRIVSVFEHLRNVRDRG